MQALLAACSLSRIGPECVQNDAMSWVFLPRGYLCDTSEECRAHIPGPVSYTHLLLHPARHEARRALHQVSLARRQPDRHRTNLCQGKHIPVILTAPPLERGDPYRERHHPPRGARSRSISVSYTHLVPGPGPGVKARPHLAGIDFVHTSQPRPRPLKAAPVSYTHLDVYKRQQVALPPLA